MRIGYARVSSQHQKLDRQMCGLEAERVDRLFTEKASGKSTKDRPQLEKAIDLLGTGDTLLIAEWDRATRSMLDGIKIIERIHARGAFLRVLDKPHLDFTTPIGARLHRVPVRDGRGRARTHHQARARRQGGGPEPRHAHGRKPKLTDYQQAEALKRLMAGEICRAVAKSYRVHHAAVSRLRGA
jgi:DNA invertase Pin-like site-specific DNA recombinase